MSLVPAGIVRAIAAIGALLVLAACESAGGLYSEGQPGPTDAAVAGREYRLGPGDSLRVVVFGQTDLTNTFQVSGHGAINYPLIGEVPAEGLTTSQLGESIAVGLRGGYVRNPNVSVEVLTYRPFFILGEVQQPGTYPYSAGLTVMNAVATAGGFTYRANSHLVVIKHAGQEAENRYALDSRTIVQPGDTVRLVERIF